MQFYIFKVVNKLAEKRYMGGYSQKRNPVSKEYWNSILCKYYILQDIFQY